MSRRPHITNETRLNIIEAYLLASKEKRGKKVAVQDVINKSGYNRTTLYRYFRSMKQLHDFANMWMHAKTATNHHKIRHNTRLMDTKAMALDAINAVLVNKKKVLLLCGLEDEARFKKEFIDSAMNSYRLANKNLAKGHEDYFRLLTHYHLSGTIALYVEYIRDPGNVSMESLGNMFAQLHIDGITKLVNRISQLDK